MKTRKSTHAAFAHPDMEWSRKRSVRIVIRIQIQMTKKKTSKAISSASPKLMSANGSTCIPFSRCRGGMILETFGEENRGHGGGQVETGNALAHRNAEAGVGPLDQRIAEAVAL